MTEKTVIKTPEEYFSVLNEFESSPIDAEKDSATAKALHSYLIGLSPMGREQLAVHAPDDEMLRVHHREWLDRIEDSPAHNAFMRRLVNYGGFDYELDYMTNAAAGALLVQKHIANHKERIKTKGRLVQCNLCAGYCYSSETERIKAYGSTRYMRFCTKCAEKVKAAKSVYQGIKRMRSK